MSRHYTPAHRLLVPAVAVLAASSVLVACSHDGTTTDKVGPISALYDAMWGEDYQVADSIRYEEAVATCMKENGFEYTPTPMEDTTAMAGPMPQADWDPVANAKVDGYGIALFLGLDDDDDNSGFAKGDPNRIYYDALSDEEQAAYSQALHGTPTLDEPDPESYWTTGGCYGEAFHEVYESQNNWPDMDTPSVMDDYWQFVSDKVENDPRIGKAATKWSACMSNKGYQFTELADARESIQQRYDDLLAVDWTTQGWEADLAALRADEIATATADAQCRVKAGVDQAYDDAWFDGETEFYNAHRAEVDAWFAEQEASRPKR